jgi:uncharacterized repeat protein (TIGR03833 family)
LALSYDREQQALQGLMEEEGAGAYMSSNGQQRAAIRAGLVVDIVLKKDQATGKVTRGVVKDILTNSPNHPHGIKVRLQSGDVGRVKSIIGTEG